MTDRILYDDTLTVQAAIAAVIRDLPGIGKGDRAPSNMGGFRYRGIEDMTRAIQPLLGKYGLVIVPVAQEMETVPSLGSKNDAMQDTRIRFQWLIVGPDGSTIEAATWGIGRDHTDKGGNKAQTQAYKYLLMHLFCVSDPNDDADGHDYTRAAADNPSPMAGPDPVKLAWERVLSWRGTPQAEEIKSFADGHAAKLTEKSLADDVDWLQALTEKLDALDEAAAQDQAAEGPTAPQEASDEPEGADTAEEAEIAAEGLEGQGW